MWIMEEIMQVSSLWWVASSLGNISPPGCLPVDTGVRSWDAEGCTQKEPGEVWGSPLGGGKWGCRALFWQRSDRERGEHQWPHSNFHWFFMAHCGERQNACESWNKISLLQVKLAQLVTCSDYLYSTQISKCFYIKSELSLKIHIHLQTCLFCSWSLSLHSVVMSGCFHVLFWHCFWYFFHQPQKKKEIKMEPCGDAHSNPWPRQGSLCVAQPNGWVPTSLRASIRPQPPLQGGIIRTKGLDVAQASGRGYFLLILQAVG